MCFPDCRSLDLHVHNGRCEGEVSTYLTWPSHVMSCHVSLIYLSLTYPIGSIPYHVLHDSFLRVDPLVWVRQSWIILSLRRRILVCRWMAAKRPIIGWVKILACLSVKIIHRCLRHHIGKIAVLHTFLFRGLSLLAFAAEPVAPSPDLLSEDNETKPLLAFLALWNKIRLLSTTGAAVVVLLCSCSPKRLRLAWSKVCGILVKSVSGQRC